MTFRFVYRKIVSCLLAIPQRKYCPALFRFAIPGHVAVVYHKSIRASVFQVRLVIIFILVLGIVISILLISPFSIFM